MVIYYSLAKSPATHDFVNFLVRAEEARIAEGAEYIDLKIVPGRRVQSPRDVAYSFERKVWRIHNLLMPLARCLPSVRSVSLGDGEQKLSYLNFKEPVPPVLEAPAVARSIVSAYLNGIEKPVTITLRQSEFETVRNSNLHEWERVAAWLINNGYTPIYVPDGEALMLGEAKLFYKSYTPASMSPEIRLALYEQTVCNLMTTGGPMVLSLMSDVPLMAWKLIVSGLQCTTEEHMRRSAMSPQDDWGPYKKLYWEEDKAAFIIPQLKEWLPRMEQRPMKKWPDVFSLRDA